MDHYGVETKNKTDVEMIWRPRLRQ